MDGLMVRLLDCWLDGSMGGWMDGRLGGQTD